MTTTLSAHGGGAQPARIDTSGNIAGGTARRVYGFDSEAAALAAGYVCEGGPAISVALITDAQLASGEWKLDGDPFSVVIYTAPDGLPTEGGLAVPVYAVNGWGSAPVPPSGPVLLLDLEADTLALSDGDPVATWADQSGNGYDFTQTGSARPTYRAGGGNPYVEFDGSDDLMVGSNFADSLDSFTVLYVVNADGTSKTIVGKESDDFATGWESGVGTLYWQKDSTNNFNVFYNPALLSNVVDAWAIHAIEKLSATTGHYYLNGDNGGELMGGSGNPVTEFSNVNPVLLMPYTENILLRAVRIYSPALDDADRAAKEAELAARYGITL